MNAKLWRYVFIPCLILFLSLQAYVFLEKHFSVKEKITGVQIGGNFHLMNEDNKFVRASDYRDKFMMVYFGFTNCPNICPVDLQSMADVLDALGEDAEEIWPIFITLDPERDGTQRMKEYTDNFHPRIEGLTGEPEYIAKAAKMYKIFYSKVPMGDPGDYMINHSGHTYFMGRNGEYLTHFNHGQPVEDIVKVIRKHL